MIYIYLDGSEVTKSTSGLRPDDLAMILDGDLQVLRVENESVQEAQVEEIDEEEEDNETVLNLTWSEASPRV